MEAPVKLRPSLNDSSKRRQSGRILTSQVQPWQRPQSPLCVQRAMDLAPSCCLTTSGVSVIELISQQRFNKMESTIENNRTSILLTKSHDDSQGTAECSYCQGKRNTFTGEEKDLKYYKTGFTTNKLRADDYEILLSQGFTRCGTYVYARNQVKCCCENY